MEWTTLATMTARAGAQAYANRQLIQRYWTKLKAYLDAGQTQIIVTGHPGAGKTLLASQMHGRARDLVFELPSESRTVEVEAFDSTRWAKIVRVLPGQAGFRSEGAVETFTRDTELEGVIHVVDFGYVVPRDAAVARAMISRDQVITVDTLRQINLDSELGHLRILLNDLRRSIDLLGLPRWLIIAVNKVDLFADDREDALDYYHPEGSSQFASEIRSFLADIGSTNLSVYVLQSAAYEQDFVWNEHTVRSLLERQEQTKILSEFMKTVAAIVDNHS